MRTLLFITVLNLVPFHIYAQEFAGYYTGKLLAENNLLVVEKDNKGNYFVELHSSEKNSYKLDAAISDNSLVFSLPTFDGSDLQIISVKSEEGLQLSFIMSGEKYTTDFKIIELPKKNTVSAFFKKIDRVDNFDQNLIGEWRLVGAFDADENPIIDEFYKKNYVTTFLKDGTFKLDPRYFWDLDKKNGQPDLFRPNDIPNGSWSTSNNQTLKESIGEYSRESIYKISNDTLRIFSPNDNRLIYIKKK
jgi:hypothetical protein